MFEKIMIFMMCMIYPQAKTTSSMCNNKNIEFLILSACGQKMTFWLLIAMVICLSRIVLFAQSPVFELLQLARKVT